MRALDFTERAPPGASLILDLDVHAAPVADLGADRKDAARLPGGAVRARIRRQLTGQQDRVVSRGVAVQKTGDKSARMPDLITAAGKRKGARALLRWRDTSWHLPGRTFEGPRCRNLLLLDAHQAVASGSTFVTAT